MMRPLSPSGSVAVDDRANPAATTLDYSVNSMVCVVAPRPPVEVKCDGRHLSAQRSS
jgi:hypothetical protein